MLNKEKTEILKKCGSVSQLARANKYTFSQGRAKGLDAIDVNNGNGLSFTVLEGRNLDIHWCEYKGINLTYTSKNSLIAPQFISEKADSWLYSFNGGLLTTCGMTTAGAISNENDEILPLHGILGSIPAEEVSIKTYWEDNNYYIVISGSTYETKLFGVNLKLSREIKISSSENKIYLHDKVENLGFKPSPLMMIYHMNFGYPLLDEGGKIYITSSSSIATSEASKQKLNHQYKVEAPQSDIEENVYFHEMEKSHGYGLAALVNDNLLENGLGIYIKTDLEELPYFTQWKMMGEGEYVVGLEPCNCMTLGRPHERERGTLKFINPQEVKNFYLEFGIFEDTEEFIKKHKLEVYDI